MNVFLSSPNNDTLIVMDLMARLLHGGMSVESSPLCALPLTSSQSAYRTSAIARSDIFIALLDEDWYLSESTRWELQQAVQMKREGKGITILFANLCDDTLEHLVHSQIKKEDVLDMEQLVDHLYRFYTWN